MINDFYQKLYVTRRPSWTTDEEGNAYSEIAEVSQFYGHIQQASPELVESLGFTFTKLYSIWCPVNSDVETGDILLSTDGQYSVKAIQENNIGDNKHLQLVVHYDGIIGS
jgi:hypothetical protein